MRWLPKMLHWHCVVHLSSPGIRAARGLEA